jgi:hypothetical protein
MLRGLTDDRRGSRPCKSSRSRARVVLEYADWGLPPEDRAATLASSFLPSPDAANVRLAAIRELPTADVLAELAARL